MRTVVPTSPPADPVVADARALGAAIRAARTGARVTVLDAAAAIGVSRQTMVNIETGKGAVALPIVLRAAAELGVTLFAVSSADRDVVRRAILNTRGGVVSDGA
jgi:DNA-binding XRE family transcriptional regulator